MKNKSKLQSSENHFGKTTSDVVDTGLDGGEAPQVEYKLEVDREKPC